LSILVCAATRSELHACQRAIHESSSPGFEALLTGVGPTRAASALGDRLARGRLPHLVVSTGLVGILGGPLSVGSWITAKQISELGAGSLVDVAVDLRLGPGPSHACRVVSANRVLRTLDVPWVNPSVPLAADMESAALARVSARHGRPLMVLRLVSDTPSDSLPAFLSPLAAAMAATRVRSRVAHAFRGAGMCLVDPRGMVRLVHAGREWTRSLALGWRRFAPTLAAEHSWPRRPLEEKAVREVIEDRRSSRAAR